jgi:hypothetical protein
MPTPDAPTPDPPTVGTDPDPYAALPQGDWLMLQNGRSSAPLAGGVHLEQAQASAPLSGRKPLRRPKGPIPRASSIDPSLELNARTARPPLAPSALAPAAPAIVPLITPFIVGEDDETSIPPDTHAAVGKAHVFAPHNNNIAVYDLTGRLISRASLNSFWTGLGLNGHTFDPKILHDPVEDRFYLVSMADAESSTSRLLIACSDSGDPTAGWRSFALQVDPAAQGPVWMDYPSLGFSSDKISVGVNLFSIANNAFSGATVYSFDKAAFLNAARTIAVQRFMLPNMGFTHVPAVTLDPGVADHYVAATWSGNAGGKGFLLILKLSGSVANGAATLNKVGFVTSPQTWDSNPPVADLAPQAGTAAKVSAGDDRMQHVVLRGGILSCCHTAFLPQGGNASRSAILCWDAPIATWAATTVRLEGTNGEFFAHPSLAVNSRGEKLVGHSVFSPALHPSGGYHFIPQGGAPAPLMIFAAGTDTYEKRFGGAENRWGDYSATMTSPNGDDFWTIQAQSDAPDPAWAEHGRWTTKIVNVGAPPPLVAAAGEANASI